MRKKCILNFVLIFALLMAFCPTHISANSVSTGECGDSVSWTLYGASQELVISGNGEMADYVYTADIPWYGLKTYVTFLTVEDGVTNIGDGAFFNCVCLTRITLSKTVKTIGESSFAGCVSLIRLTIPDTITSIGKTSFYTCSNLEECHLSNNLKDIPYGAFASCNSLTSISIPSGVKHIGELAFSQCDNLQDVYYSGSYDDWNAIEIEDGNTALTNATIHCGNDGKEPISISAQRNADSLNVSLNQNAEGTLIAAQYDNRNILKKTTNIPVTKNSKNYSLNIENAGYKLKVMLWDGFKNLTPLANTYDIDADNCYISYNLNYGSNKIFATEAVPRNSTAYGDAMPERDGYAFCGWYNDADCTEPFDFRNTVVGNDMTLYAAWMPISLTIDKDNYIVAPKEENIETDGETNIEFVNNELILHMAHGTSKDKVLNIIRDYDAYIIGEITAVDTYQIMFRQNYTYNELEGLKTDLEKNKAISWVSENMIFDAEADYFPTSDSKWANDWNDVNPNGLNWGVEAINAPQAWNFRNQMNYVNVGVFDCCFFDHEDLTYSNRYFNHPDECTEGAHGTHVSGTIAAGYDNGIGISGVAPKVNLYGFSYNNSTVRNNTLTFEMVFSQLIVMDKCKVLNFSNTTGEAEAAVASTIDTKYRYKIMSQANEVGLFLQNLIDSNHEFTICVAAGNGNNKTFYKYENKKYPQDVQYFSEKQKNMQDDYTETQFVCAAYNAKYNNILNAIEQDEVKNRIIVVGSCKNQGNGMYGVSDFSGRGSRVDVIAPGEDIYSTVNNSRYANHLPDGQPWSGTSMATPHVSGVAAMIYAINPNIKGDQVKQIIVDTSNIISSEDVKIYGECYKMVDAGAAVRKCIPTEHTVHFDANYGTVSPKSITVINGQKYGTLPTPIRDGYIFDGWFLNETDRITSDTIVNIYDNVTLVAYWIKNGIHIKFDSNGGTVSQQEKIVQYGQKYGSLPIPKRTGYTFDGWYLDGYKEITSENIVEITEDSTLIAQWWAENYTVTFNAMGGVVSQESKIVTYDETYGTLPTPTRERHMFKGWFTSTSYNNEVSSGTIVSVATSHTLYAKWEESKLPTTVTISPYTYNQLGQATQVQGTLYSTEGDYLGSSYGFATWTCKIPDNKIPGYIIFDGYMGNYQVGGLYRFTDNDYAGLRQYYYSQTVSANATLYTGYKGSYSDFAWTWSDDFDWSLITK